MSDDLTSDNARLSRPTNRSSNAVLKIAVDCKSNLSDRVAGYVADSLADNTRRAYLSDLAHFEGWGGRIPASDTVVASYLVDHAETLSVATLVRRLASIAKAHNAIGIENPIQSALVRATLRGIKRRCGTAQREARPLLREDLFAVLDAMGDTTKDARDRALLLIGFAGGFRRSELVAIDIDAVEVVRQGAIVTIPRSKTDQVAAGRKLAIPNGRTRHCPVAALEGWIARAGLTEGAVFRPIYRHSRIKNARLSGEAVSLIIKERVARAGFDPARYSGHSLRAGLATSAAQAGVSILKIKAQTGHASDAMLGRYVRDGQIFANNAAGALL
jgi:integrase